MSQAVFEDDATASGKCIDDLLDIPRNLCEERVPKGALQCLKGQSSVIEFYAQNGQDLQVRQVLANDPDIRSGIIHSSMTPPSCHASRSEFLPVTASEDILEIFEGCVLRVLENNKNQMTHGPSGMTFGHLLSACRSYAPVLPMLTWFTNKLIRNQLPQNMRLSSAWMTSLETGSSQEEKKEGPPNSVNCHPEVLMHLTWMCATEGKHSEFALPHQLGLVRNGCNVLKVTLASHVRARADHRHVLLRTTGEYYRLSRHLLAIELRQILPQCSSLFKYTFNGPQTVFCKRMDGNCRAVSFEDGLMPGRITHIIVSAVLAPKLRRASYISGSSTEVLAFGDIIYAGGKHEEVVRLCAHLQDELKDVGLRLCKSESRALCNSEDPADDKSSFCFPMDDEGFLVMGTPVGSHRFRQEFIGKLLEDALKDLKNLSVLVLSPQARLFALQSLSWDLFDKLAIVGYSMMRDDRINLLKNFREEMITLFCSIGMKDRVTKETVATLGLVKSPLRMPPMWGEALKDAHIEHLAHALHVLMAGRPGPIQNSLSCLLRNQKEWEDEVMRCIKSMYGEWVQSRPNFRDPHFLLCLRHLSQSKRWRAERALTINLCKKSNESSVDEAEDDGSECRIQVNPCMLTEQKMISMIERNLKI